MRMKGETIHTVHVGEEKDANEKEEFLYYCSLLTQDWGEKVWKYVTIILLSVSKCDRQTDVHAEDSYCPSSRSDRCCYS